MTHYIKKTIPTDSKDPSEYIKDMRRRDNELSKGWGQIATPLRIETPAQRTYKNKDVTRAPLISGYPDSVVL